MTAFFPVPADLDPADRAAAAPAPGQRLPGHGRDCYGCGPDAPHGLHLELFAGDGVAVTARMRVRPRFEGGPGTIHGGVLASAFDEVMGHVPTMCGRFCVTGHLQVDFAAPVPLGVDLYLRATALGVQRRKVFTEAHAWIVEPGPDGIAVEPGASGIPVAAAHGLFVQIDPASHYGAVAAGRRSGAQKS
ncbi:PaaI family thioesterase [Williamsia sterculiae]|uniref:Acyl-coenzyme A thioesterase THEM4 n=1 Tax=Williamsia sterculiae TaxID=1344003 RepID=A0A1N7CTQ7_9NOCA|nr:PaaI family thioesterase [Williamsia sterculiae]SIR66845.1 Thioesterase superfamily protein [Williamsia sterculiae]